MNWRGKSCTKAGQEEMRTGVCGVWRESEALQIAVQGLHFFSKAGRKVTWRAAKAGVVGWERSEVLE